MRQLVFVSVLLFPFVLLSQARAEIKSPPPSNSNIKEFESEVECTKPTDTVDLTKVGTDPEAIQTMTLSGISCTVARQSVCKALNLPGCAQTNPNPTMSRVVWPTDMTELEKKVNDVIAQCKQNQDEVKKSCAGTADDASAVVDTLKPKDKTGADAGGLNQAACTQKDGLTKQTVSQATSEGNCKSAKFSCAYIYGNAANDLSAAEACHTVVGGDLKCAELKQQLDTAVADCLKPSDAAKDAADKSLASALTANKSCGGTASDPNADPGGKTKVEKSAAADTDKTDPEGGGGGGGMNPGMLGQMLSALANQPTTPPPVPPNAASAAATNAASPNCSNPAVQAFGCSPAPTTQATNNFPKNSGTGGLSPQSAKGDNNVGDIKDNLGGGQPPLGMGGMAGAKINNADVVQNGGGGMAGGQQGGGAGSMARAAAAGAGLPSHPPVNFSGERSGGFSSSPGDGSPQTSAGGWGGYGRDGGIEPINLAAWIDKRMPKRGPAGDDAKLMQIHPKEVNIFTRISEHIKARCNQGLLRDCIP